MRITNNVVISNMMKQLQDNMEKLDNLNQQLSTGKQFQVPSENPIKATTSMQLSSIIRTSEQYKRNVDRARTWLSSTESSLNAATDVLQRARVLGLSAANDSKGQDQREYIAKEIKQLKDELISIANTKLGDRYLFAGQSTGQKPFANDGTYQGDKHKIQREINGGINMTINYNGEEAFREALDTLDSLYNNLMAGNVEDISNIDIDNIDEAITSNNALRAEIGAKMNRLDLTEKRLDDEILNLKKLLSRNEDVDIAKTITDIKMQETVYRASLASNTRIMQPTLVDFLR